MNRVEKTIDDLIELDKSQYCDLGPGKGIIALGLKAANKNVVAVEAPWASEENKSWARISETKIYFQEFFTGDFSLIEEEIDCFILAHSIAHFRYSPYILFKKVYDLLPKGGLFYLSTVNGTSFDRVMNFYKGKPIVEKVSKNLDPGFNDVAKDFNKTGLRMIWDDWMHVKEYTKPEIEEIFTQSGFNIYKSFYRNSFSHWKRDLVIKFRPHLSEEIIVVGVKQ